MNSETPLYRLSKLQQWFLSISLVIFVSLSFFLSGELFGYRIVSFGLLSTVAFLALIVDIYPVLVSAFLSALIWNFFFIPPIYTFHIANSEDLFMFFSFFILASVHAVLTHKIRRVEQRSRELKEHEKLLSFYKTFWNSLSHELKTPISTIIGSVDLLRNNEIQISETQRNHVTFEIERASKRLQNQVDNLLAMSRIDANAHFLKLDWYDISEIINNLILREFEIDIQQRIEVTMDESIPLVRIDSMVFDIVLKNLLQNALNYSPAEEIVTISVEWKLDALYFSVSDKGIGISQDNYDHIFNRFYRVSNLQTGGIGLGLSIVKGLVELHEGEVNVSSILNKGTTFTVVIPCAASFIKNLSHD